MHYSLARAVLAATLLVAPAQAGSWQTSEDHSPMVLKDGKEFPRSTFRLVGAIEGPSRSGGTVPMMLSISCTESVLDNMNLHLTVPLDATAFAGHEDKIKGKQYRWNISARLTGSDSRPVVLHQQAVFPFAEENPTLRFGIARFGFIASASMSGNDIRAALDHLSSPSAQLSVIVGHSLKFPGGVYSGRIALGDVAEIFRTQIAAKCPSLSALQGERDQPEEVTKVQTRSVNWYEFESTRFSRAQREDFERKAKGILHNAEVLVCTFKSGQAFEYWYKDVPEGVSELIRISKRKDTRGARLGRMAVNRCPDTTDLSNLVRALAWP
jgi:hypothetical protein